jgi:hypothetical protein
LKQGPKIAWPLAAEAATRAIEGGIMEKLARIGELTATQSRNYAEA